MNETQIVLKETQPKTLKISVKKPSCSSIPKVIYTQTVHLRTDVQKNCINQNVSESIDFRFCKLCVCLVVYSCSWLFPCLTRGLGKITPRNLFQHQPLWDFARTFVQQLINVNPVEAQCRSLSGFRFTPVLPVVSMQLNLICQHFMAILNWNLRTSQLCHVRREKRAVQICN